MEVGRYKMFKVVVFDGGYGGELFADRLKEELPIVEVIRVIDWRNADKLLYSAKTARKIAIEALMPYIGEVDIIILANHLLSITSLRYFERKYRHQKFIGFGLPLPRGEINTDALVLTTRAVTRTVNYYNYLFRLSRNTKTLKLDHWAPKIDDGELEFDEIKTTLGIFLNDKRFQPKELILACAQFSDVKRELRRVLGWNVKTYDSFDYAIKQIGRVLEIKGVGKKRKK